MQKDQIVEENMKLWLSNVEKGDPKTVAKMYSEDSFFLPTVSGDFKKGQAGAEDYFVHFLSKNPKGSVLESETSWLSDDSYLHAGMYNFELDAEDGREMVEARFTYLWRKNDKKVWEIIHHHSSARPNSH